MKHLTFIVALIVAITGHAVGQNKHKLKKSPSSSTYDPAPEEPLPVGRTISIYDAGKHLGQLVNLCDTVNTYPVQSGSLILFCMGGHYPHQLLTVAVNDRRHVFSVDTFLGKPMCVRGVLTSIDGQPRLIITGPEAMLFFSYPKGQ